MTHLKLNRNIPLETTVGKLPHNLLQQLATMSSYTFSAAPVQTLMAVTIKPTTVTCQVASYALRAAAAAFAATTLGIH